MTQLTLCMIVRDEEVMLADCLDSARAVVDRMVIVDTGSRDGTRAILERFGAEIVDHTWNDDFAAARNAGLERIDSGYVLILDADERLTPEGAAELRSTVERGEIDLGLLPLHDAVSLSASSDDVISGRARRGEAQLLPRLLRWSADLRFEGIVHESVGGWAREGRRSAEVSAPIVHYGAAPELRAERGKDERNRHLLERRCELAPDDAMARAYLAAELDRAGETEAALAAAREAWEIWQAGGASAQAEVVLPATLFGQLALRIGTPDEVVAAMTTALAVEEHPNFHFLSGVAHEQTARTAGPAALERAAGHYERCLDLAGRSYTGEVMAGATSWQAEIRLGTVRLQQDRAQDARGLFDRALQSRPEAVDATLGLAEATLLSGDAEAAIGLVEPIVLQPNPLPDAWLLAASAAARIGAQPDAELFLRNAQAARLERNYLAPHRERSAAELAAKLGSEPNAESEASGVPCAFAWPCYDAAGDLDRLLGEFGKVLAEQPGMVLCLRHDPKLDGDIATAESRLERAFADHLGEGHTLDVVLIDPKHRASELAAPGDIAIELPGSTAERQQFLSELGARCVNSRASLEAVLAGPA